MASISSLSIADMTRSAMTKTPEKYNMDCRGMIWWSNVTPFGVRRKSKDLPALQVTMRETG